MSDGTFGTFQGIPVRAVTYRRARGATPGGAEILLFGRDFPSGFECKTPAPGQLAVPAPPPETTSPTGSQTKDAPITPVTPARQLAYEGFLVMSETVDGKTWAHPPVRLFVERVETVKLADQGGTAIFKVVAWDERYHWDHGWLKRWSFNRRRTDGTISLDSVNPDGSPVTVRQIADTVVGSLFRKPALKHAPPEWSQKTAAMDFGPNPAPISALMRLVREHDLELPCLRLDGSVALHRAGDGFVGYAEDPGGPNSKPFPPGMLLWKDGTGQGYAIELGYPEDFVLVAGGPRVVTIALDDCEPVVIVEDLVYVLNEENVRFLTGGAQGLDWLKKFVFSPPEWAGDPGIPEPILEIFRTQAYRLWRIPGVEVETKASEPAPKAAPAGAEAQGDAAQPDATQERPRGVAPDPWDPRIKVLKPGAPPSGPGADQEGLPAGKKQRGIVREPGPNAHLVPLLPRAESSASKRLPVMVETYTFAVKRRKLAGSGAGARQRAALEELRKLRDQIAARAAQLGNPNPFNPRPGGPQQQFRRGLGVLLNPLTDPGVPAGSMLTGEAAIQMGKAGVGVGSLEDFVRQVRTLERIAEQAGSGFAGLYEKALLERYAAEDEALGADVNKTLFDLAKRFREHEKTANDEGSSFRTTAEAMRELGLDKLFSEEVLAAMNKLRQQKEQTKQRGGAGEGENTTHTFFVNVERTVDAGARVYDAERGIVETSGLAGHLKDVNVHDLGHPDAELVPCPVRVTFGAHLRPRVDVPPGTPPPRPKTGPADTATDCPGGQSFVPAALTDEESYFLAAFSRGPNGEALPMDPKAVPADQVLVVQRPDLCELVPIVGEGNVGELRRQSQEVAAELFKRPTIVRGATGTLARAWPIQPDGLIEEVTIQMRQEDGIPCGYETVIRVGGEPRTQHGATRERGGGAAALKAQMAAEEAAKRERRTP